MSGRVRTRAGEAPPPAGRVQRRQTRTRAALLDAAERAFTRDGYHGVRVANLAEEADVSVGSIYNQFSNKDGLYLAVAERATRLFAEYLERAYAVSDSPLEQVMACGDAYLRFHLDHPGAARFIAFYGLESSSSEGSRDELVDRTAAVLGRFQDTLAAAIEAGEVGDHVDPERTSMMLFGAWNGMIALSLRRDEFAVEEGDIEALIEQARRIVVEGLSAPAYRAADGRTRARLLGLADAPEPS